MTKRQPVPNWLTDSRFDISVLLPTRGRTEALKTSVMSLVDLADDATRVQFMFGFDNDDRDSIAYCREELLPIFKDKGITAVIFEFDRLGYLQLNKYVNTLALQSDADWLMFWNDDAIMETQGWDTEIARHTGKFRVLRMPTHNEHPYAIFPIVPKEWLRLLGYLSPHQISDAWISQTAYMLDAMETIPVPVIHDRHDLTGNNKDETFENRPMLEGNPSDPRDFNHPNWRSARFQDANKLAWYMKSIGEDTSWFQSVCEGTQDPWARMTGEFDPNKQLAVFK